MNKGENFIEEKLKHYITLYIKTLMSREESDPGHHNGTNIFEKFTKIHNENFFDKTKILYIYHSNNADRF